MVTGSTERSRVSDQRGKALVADPRECSLDPVAVTLPRRLHSWSTAARFQNAYGSNCCVAGKRIAQQLSLN